MKIKEEVVFDSIPFGEIESVLSFFNKIKCEYSKLGRTDITFDYRWTGYESFEFFSTFMRDENEEEIAEREREIRFKRKRDGIKEAREKRMAEEKRVARIAELKAELDSLA